MGEVNRTEIVFVYAVKDANPNGDPANENMPRFDENTETVFVSDARIKRTIRDHLIRKGQNVLLMKNVEISGNKIKLPNGEKIDLKSGDMRKKLLEFIDIRLFGAVPAGGKEGGEKGELVNIYGPVQFRFGHSLNSTEIVFVKGSSSVIRGKGEKTGKFTEKYIVPFAVISTYGIVNDAVAKEQKIPLTDEDVNLLLEGLWEGTAELQSSSKAVHIPLLLLTVKYKKDKRAFLGNLDEKIKLVSKEGEDISYKGDREKGKKIRSLSDFKLNLTELFNELKKVKEKIETVEIKKHPSLEIVPDPSSVKELSIEVEEG